MTPRIIPSFRRDLFGSPQPITPEPERPKDPSIKRWAQAMLDAELEAALESLETEEDALYVSHRCPFEEGHPGCRCDEALSLLLPIRDKIDAVRLERGLRYGMTAHQKMSRVAAARA